MNCNTLRAGDDAREELPAPAMKLICSIALALGLLMLAQGVELGVALALLFALAVWLALPLSD
jgi:hypothetical protein